MLKFSIKRSFRTFFMAAVTGLMLATSACMVGPEYKRPDAPVSTAYREPLPEGWKEAQPNDGAIRGKWWEIYNDPELNALEEQVNISNQNLLAAEAQFRAASYAVHVARAALFPTVSVTPGITTSKSGGSFVSGGTVGSSTISTFYSLGGNASWAP